MKKYIELCIIRIKIMKKIYKVNNQEEIIKIDLFEFLMQLEIQKYFWF